ncbi:DUF998 domain-containing protein [Plantactinospora sp. WMMB334]|uniref:DUF998 domain-containing protein n=1 Tax=Plantactinospora sp. WMMB334 TaxID=3404119 RepID=UPI003B959DD5
MPAVPWWGVLSSVAAPVLLAVGWSLAAVRQPPGYDPVADTISQLSSYGVIDRLILVICLAGLGVAHLVTAVGLRFVPLAGRLVHGGGGVATVVVALVPKVDSVTPPVHGIAAVIAFVALATWPSVAALRWSHRPGRRTGRPRSHLPGRRAERPRSRPPVRRGGRPWPLRLPVAFAASAVLLGSGLWLALQLPDGPTAGLAERVTAGLEALWPLVVVLTGPRRGTAAAGRHVSGSA